MIYLKKLLSRKFQVALAGFIVALTGVVSPESEDKVVMITGQVVEAILYLAPILWMIIEGRKDIVAAGNGK